MKHVAFAVPGDIATATGGYIYDRRIVAELRKVGWQVDIIGLGDGFPWPNQQQREHAIALLAGLAPGLTILVDGLALGALPELGAAWSPQRRLVALVHHPLALETGLTAAEARAIAASERRALTLARHVIVTSAETARALVADYGVPESRLTICRPGTDRSAPKPKAPGATIRLLAVGSVVQRKGHDVLVEALASLKHLPWQLKIVGDRSRDTVATRTLEALVLRHALGDRITLAGELRDDQVADSYAKADIFVLASRHEGYGMAYAEAIAHGLPVIGTTAGAIPETVPASAGLLVPPSDPLALAAALRRLIEDSKERQRLAHGARVAAAALPTWQDTAALFARALEAAA